MTVSSVPFFGKMRTEEEELATYRAYRADKRVVEDAVREGDTEQLATLAKFVTYRRLVRAKAPAEFAGQAAARDERVFEKLPYKERQEARIDGLAPAVHFEAHYGTTVPRRQLRPCYMCRKSYFRGDALGAAPTDVGGHADFCFECGVFNLECGRETSDLTGKTALVTGCRHTVGLAMAVRLLRMGATVIGTTRFPNAALLNYQSQPDYSTWHHRLRLFACDFTVVASVRRLLDDLAPSPPDIFISNAFLTVEQSAEYYKTLRGLEKHMVEAGGVPLLTEYGEQQQQLLCTDIDKLALVEKVCTDSRGWLTQTGHTINQHGNLDEPPRETLWTQTLDETSESYIVQTNMVNQIVPTLLFREIYRLMSATAKNEDTPSPRVLINVTSTEHLHRVPVHVVTGMQKAAMENLIDRMSYSDDSWLHVYSADPGFVTGVVGTSQRPLTSDDGAARVLYPLVRLLNGTPPRPSEIIWKDFRPTRVQPRGGRVRRESITRMKRKEIAV